MKKGLIVGLCIFVSLVTVCSLFVFLRNGTSVSAAEVPIIMYHSVENTEGTYYATPEKFESDIIALKNAGYTPVSFKQVIDFVYNGAELPEKSVVITLDDGYKNNYTTVLPIAEKHGVPVEVFAVAGFVNVHGSAMTWNEAKAFNNSSYGNIGCHTYNLHVNPDRYGVVRNESENYRSWEHIFRNDLDIARGLFTEQLGSNPVTFAYPYGSFSTESEDILREEGYLLTVTTEPGVNIVEKGNKESLYLMLRISMDGVKETPVKMIEKHKNIHNTTAIASCKAKVKPGFYVSRGQALDALYGKQLENMQSNFAYVNLYRDMKYASDRDREIFAKCVQKGIVSGFTDLTMRPSHYITRGEFAILLARCTGYDGREATHTFADGEPWNDWALSWCAEKGYMIGYGESFGVNDFLTKEQIDIVCKRVGF